MGHWKDQQLNAAKEILAFELTKLVHGEAEAKKAEESAKALFGGGGQAADMPETQLPADAFRDGAIDILSLLVMSGLCASRGDARRNVEQGGVSAGEEKITDIGRTFDRDAFAGGLVLRKGKKNYHRFKLG